MAFRVQFSSLVNRQIASWQLSDTMLVDVNIRLRRDLAQNPAQSLVRVRTPFDGMGYLFSMVVHPTFFVLSMEPGCERILKARAEQDRRRE